MRIYADPAAVKRSECDLFVALKRSERDLCVALNVIARSCGQHMAPFASKVHFISRQLFLCCVAPDEGERLRQTGILPPKSSLKHRACRKAFAWCSRVHEARFFTRGAIRSSLERLLNFYEVEVPLFNTPGLTREDWIKRQTLLVQHLCKRSVKNASARAAMSLDDVETQIEDIVCT